MRYISGSIDRVQTPLSIRHTRRKHWWYVTTSRWRWYDGWLWIWSQNTHYHFRLADSLGSPVAFWVAQQCVMQFWFPWWITLFHLCKCPTDRFIKCSTVSAVNEIRRPPPIINPIGLLFHRLTNWTLFSDLKNILQFNFWRNKKSLKVKNVPFIFVHIQKINISQLIFVIYLAEKMTELDEEERNLGPKIITWKIAKNKISFRQKVNNKNTTLGWKFRLWFCSIQLAE